MSTNPIMTAIYTAFKLEIANPFTVTNKTVTVMLPDQNRLKIQVIQVKPNSTHTATTLPAIPRDQHTFHYLHQHDYAAKNYPLQKLLLHNITECRAYLDDVCITFLNIKPRDGEIQFSDNTAYLLVISK